MNSVGKQTSRLSFYVGFVLCVVAALSSHAGADDAEQETTNAGSAEPLAEEEVHMNLEGKQAPAFELEGSDGKQHALSDYSGRTVVLYFYPKDNTPGCTKEACGFRDANVELKKLGVVVLGVSRDDLPSHQRFTEEYELPFVLLSDPEAKVLRKYGAWGKKMRYGKEVEGIIRSTVVIDGDGRVIKHWPTVRDAAAHPDTVLAYLRDR